MCWVTILYAVAIAIVGEVLKPKAKFDQGKPIGVGDIDFPTAETGRVFPWAAGTVKQPGPNLTAFTGLRNEKSKKKVKTGLFSHSKQLLGYRYYATLQMVFCAFSGRPNSRLDDIVGFQINDKFLKMTSKIVHDDYFDVFIDDPAFNGDPKSEGGYAGSIRIYRGTDGQPYDADLAEAVGDPDLSAYPCVVHAVFKDFYLGMSLNSVPPIIPVYSVWHNSLGLTDNKHIIGGTANNAICVIYEMMTDEARGMGIEPSLINRDVFLAAAEICYNEKIGLNLLLDTNSTGRQVLDDLQRYIDGQVFEDPFLALWTITLARPNYDVDDADLIELNDDNSTIVESTKTTWADTKNTFNIKYTDKTKNWTTQGTQTYDMGNLVARNGQVAAVDFDYTAADNLELALFLAERARTGLSGPFRQFTIEAMGQASLLKLNDVFRGRYPSKRVDKMALRVQDIEYPTTDDGVTNLVVVEDKFGVQYVAYDGVPANGWTPPDYDPAPARRQVAQEVPYALTPDLSQNRYILTAATRNSALEVAYDVLNTTAAAITNVDNDFTPSGQLRATMNAYDRVRGNSRSEAIRVSSVIDGQELENASNETYMIGDSLLLIGEEIFAFQNVEVDQLTGDYLLYPWRRALYDTVPGQHAAGDAVFFLAAGAGLAQDLPYAGNGPVQLKLLTKTPTEELDAARATEITVNVQQRAARPYLPAQMQINGTPIQAVQASDALGDTISFSWAPRNRDTQGQAIVAYDDPGVDAPLDVMYAIRIMDAAGNLLVQKLDIAGNGATASLAYIGAIRVQIYSRTATLDSYYKYQAAFNYTMTAGATQNVITSGNYTPAQTVIDGGEVKP